MADEPENVVEAPSVQEPESATPWSKDLEDLGLGDHMQTVDQFLREKVQPYVTQVEQEKSEYAQFFEDVDSARIAAQVANGLFDESYQETLNQLDSALGWGLFNQEDADVAVGDGIGDFPVEEQEAPQVALPPEYQEYLDNKMAEDQLKEQREAIDSYLNEKAGHYGDAFDRDLYEMVFSHGTVQGIDFEAIDKAYEQWYDKAHPQPTPPAVLSDDTGVSLPDPKAGDVESFDDATELLIKMMEQNSR